MRLRFMRRVCQLLTSHIPGLLFPRLEKWGFPYLASKADVGKYLAHGRYSVTNY